MNTKDLTRQQLIALLATLKGCLYSLKSAHEEREEQEFAIEMEKALFICSLNPSNEDLVDGHFAELSDEFHDKMAAFEDAKFADTTEELPRPMLKEQQAEPLIFQGLNLPTLNFSDMIGKKLEDVKKDINSKPQGQNVRIRIRQIKMNGKVIEHPFVTMELRSDRLNFWVEDGIVTKVTRG